MMKKRLLNPVLHKRPEMTKKEAKILLRQLSQINDELDRRTNSVADSASEHFNDVGSNSINAHNFDIMSQYTNKTKSSYYNIKKMGQNIVHKNRTIKMGRMVKPILEGKDSNEKIRDKKNQMFPLLQYNLIQN